MRDIIKQSLAELHNVEPGPGSLDNMTRACVSLTATLNEVAAHSLFDTEPARLERTLDALATSDEAST